MQPTEVGATEWLANLSIGYVVAAAFVLTLLRLVLVPNRGAFARSVAELVESLIIAGVLVFLVIRPFFLQAFFIPSESMEPTLMGHNKGISPTMEEYQDTVHDHIFVNKMVYRLREPKRGEIIVFKAEKKADKSSELAGRQPVENVLIKRLIAIPGDTVELKEDETGTLRVYVNSKVLQEAYVKKPMNPNPQTGFGTGSPLKLGPADLFVMGDNRNNSNDSRFWGPLPRNRVIGKAEVIFWPLSRIRLIR